jgi:phage baseplate assembly protein gpV
VQQPDGSKTMFVRLSIFSMDKLMTLDKSANVFVAKKLGSGIMANECKKYFVGNNVIQENHDHRQCLKYNQEVIGPNNKSLIIPSEIIHPYLVQYNETFYDFLVRTANRCGEFLYYEDGQLILGLPDSGDPKLIERYASITYQCVSDNGGHSELYTRDSMKDGLGKTDDTNYNRVGKNPAGFPRDLFPKNKPYHSELSSDEFFFPLFADKFTSLSREMGYEGGSDDISTSQVFSVLSEAMSSTEGAADFSTAIAADKASKQATGAIDVSNKNKAGNEKYITKNDKTEYGDGTSSVLFSSVKPDGWTTLQFYEAVRHFEEALLKEIICIDIDTYIEEVKLGQKIKIAQDGETYIVIQIMMAGEEKWSNEYDKYDTDIRKKAGGLSQKIFAIPMAELNNQGQIVKKPFPPLLPVPFIRHSEPQTAFVTDNQDPKYQGRVRIVYPWQQEFEEVRMLTTAETEYAQAIADLAATQQQLKAAQATLEQLQKEVDTLKKGKLIIVMTKTMTLKALEKQIEELKKDPEKEKAVQQLILAKQQFEAQIEQIKNMSDEEYKAYVAKMEKLIEDQKSTIEALNQKVENAQTQVGNKKQILEEKIVSYKHKIVEISSPWIRVATPMATDGGGTFFKPMMGDEVLVNYEGGNVERPYVVGSLFSKNTLAPDERINRTVGPNLHKDASIAIVSPNGHAITFKDPTNAEAFISSVYPAFGPIKDLMPLSLPDSKDVMGGIRIGDRFGLYSIDMSSDKRSVSISSSLGTVKLDAYTGITITAPNGDVKIKGKNVTIEAGNNLSLLSGDNIKKKADTSTSTAKGKVESGVESAADAGSAKVAEKVVSPLDVALFRTVLETFLKPIEGTLYVKSKRYMKLEAGSGNTIINQNRYKDWDYTKKQKLAKSQDFFKIMIDRVTMLDARLNDFTMRYCAMWMDAYNKKEAYVKAETELCTKGIVDDLITKAYDVKPDADWKDNEFKVNALEGAKLKKMKIGKGGIVTLRSDEERKSEMLPQANALGEAVHNLRTHIEGFSKLFDDMDDVGANYIDKSLKEAFQSFRYKVSTKVMSEYGTDLKGFLNTEVPEDTFVKDKMALKRKIAAAFIAKVAGDPAHKEDQYLKVGYHAEELTDEQVQDNYQWSNIVKEIDNSTVPPLLKSIGDHIKENASKSLSLDEWKEIVGDREVWDDRKGGQILFSDDENSTVNFDRGALHVERGANSYNMDRLKQVLTGLKG